MKIIKKIGFTGVALFMFCLAGQAQSNETRAKTPENAVKYAKIEIGSMGLHCPFLGTALKDKLKGTDGFSDLFVEKNDKYLTFCYRSDLNLSREDIMKIPVGIGYAEDIVKVEIADKPFKTPGDK